jgi:vacuolar-type H+-ATPase subunit I/STV1
MASYKIVPLRDESIDTEEIESGIEATSAFDLDVDLRSGMLPHTFTGRADGLCWAEYGRETYYDLTTLEGTEQTKRAERNAILFLQNGYVAIEKATKEVEKGILTTLAKVLDEDVRFETLEFDEEDLRTVIEQSSRVQRVEVSPNRREGPDYISAQDRGDLRDTDWWDQYLADPFEQVRVDLPNRNVQVDVGFDDTGRVTLYGREIEMAIQAEAMRYLTEEIIHPYRNQTDFQGTLGGYE